MKSNEVGTTLKHPETIYGNVKNLSKRMKMKDKGECFVKVLTSNLLHLLECILSKILQLRSQPEELQV
jgi:hypothetical protein